MDDVAARLAVHETACAERWKQANARLGRIDMVLAAIVMLLLLVAREASSLSCGG